MTSEDLVLGKTDFRVEKLRDLFTQNKILFNTEYQRSYIWKLPKKQLLIDSILHDYDINKIFLRQIENGAYECLDGQQRLRTIFDFLGVDKQSKDNDFPLPYTPDSNLAGKKFVDLEPRYKYKILYYTIDAVVVYQGDEETTSDIFLRLQEGIPLNSPEKLNAMRGILRNKVVEISKHPFWRSLGIENYRFGHRYLCAQIVSLELSNINLPESGPHITDIKFPTLRRNYQSYKAVNPPQKVLEAIDDTLSFLDKALSTELQTIKRKGDVIPLYLLTSYLLKRYASIKQKGDKFREFVEQFLTRVYGESYYGDPYFDYRDARSRSTESRRSIAKGFEVILGKFLEFVPELQLKDEKRSFDYGQRLAIYYRDKGKCRDCGTSLKFDEAEFHHVKRWHEGGLTTVENGLLLCAECHGKQPKFSEGE